MSATELNSVQDVSSLMHRFCSIGANCEFGIFQGSLGCHPIDLLKNAYTPLESLIELLNADLYALADPAHIRLNVETNEGHFMAFNQRFGMRWHGWAKPDGSGVTEMIEAEARRMRRLVEKMLDDIAVGERIFVRRAAVEERIEDVYALQTAMARHGANPILLWVDSESGPLTRHSGLLHGHIPTSLGTPDQTNVPKTEWLELCRSVLAGAESQSCNG